jgi:hypothetical protein
MIRVIFRDGTEREFDQIRRDRTSEGVLMLQRFGEAELIYLTRDLKEIHIREQKFAVAAE